LAEEPWVSKDWDWYLNFYGEMRWKHIPGLRMTQHKQRELWDRALEFALLEDAWLGQFPENIKVDPPWKDPDYRPAVPGKTLVRVDGEGADALIEQHGQVDLVHVSRPWWRDVDITPASLPVWVSRSVRLSDARRERREVGCYRSIKVLCSRSWGDWECGPLEQAVRWGRERSSNCADLAHDDLRWAELPGLEMTREKRHALWNRVLHQSLVRDKWLGRPSGTITLSTGLDRYRDADPDPDYQPVVAGATIELHDPDATRDVADQHGQVEYLRLSNYHWYRGPVRVYISVSREVAVCEARRSRREDTCRRTQSFECTESEDDWTCRVTGQSGDECDPSTRITTPCE
jgi:hypothetical protein